MTLSALIRKRDTGKVATAIPGISATQPKGEAGTIARIATVAVANSTEAKTVPLTAEEEMAIRAWLALIEETNPATIAEVIERCQRDADACDYFTGRTAAELPKPEFCPDDRRTCAQCMNLAHSGRCTAAQRGELPQTSRSYCPERDRPRRCLGYAPDPDDSDRRPGRERWAWTRW
jgi:hypothetical protein